MKAYLWTRNGLPVSVVDVEEPLPRSVTIYAADKRFERIFWRCQGHTVTEKSTDPGVPFRVSFIGMDYEEDEQSPRRIEV